MTAGIRIMLCPVVHGQYPLARARTRSFKVSSRRVTGWIASFQGRYRVPRLQGGGGSPAYFHTERENNMPESIYVLFN
jgi:hypothetical protein